MKSAVSVIASTWLTLGALAMAGPVVMACIAVVAVVLSMFASLLWIAYLFTPQNHDE